MFFLVYIKLGDILYILHLPGKCCNFFVFQSCELRFWGIFCLCLIHWFPGSFVFWAQGAAGWAAQGLVSYSGVVQMGSGGICPILVKFSNLIGTPRSDNVRFCFKRLRKSTNWVKGFSTHVWTSKTDTYWWSYGTVKSLTIWGSPADTKYTDFREDSGSQCRLKKNTAR